MGSPSNRLVPAKLPRHAPPRCRLFTAILLLLATLCMAPAGHTYRPVRHGPLPIKRTAASVIWDEFLTPPEVQTDATLPQEEREAIALDKMGWRRDSAALSSIRAKT
jgi:hypothetical protein